MSLMTYTLPLGGMGYPPSFATLGDRAPAVLYAAGNLSLLEHPGIAIIGTRAPTPLGERIAFSIAAYFASAGFTIVSGLARGCDTAAHRGALSVPNGRTIAVLGTPLTHIYPAENTHLAQEIVAHEGFLVSAYTDARYAPRRFFERDHLVAALSLAVIPVQMGEQSGTRHTVESALTQGKHVWVPVPLPRDEEQHPDQYAGIRRLMDDERITVFRGKEDYPHLVHLLRRFR